jgi:aspartate/methionine/tyrosine aminotransferase
MAFAGRVTHLAPEGAYEVLGKAQALEAEGRDIVHLEIGQPDVPTFGPLRRDVRATTRRRASTNSARPSPRTPGGAEESR